MKCGYKSPTKMSPSKAKLESSPTKQEPPKEYGTPQKHKPLDASLSQLTPSKVEALREGRPANNKENLLRRFAEVEREDLDCSPLQDSGYASILENDSQYQDEECEVSTNTSQPLFDTPKPLKSQIEKPLPVLSSNLLPALRFEEAVCSTLKKNIKRSTRVDWDAVEEVISSSSFRLDRLIGKRMGLERLDILGELFKKDFKHLLSKILRHLDAIDLINVICVSTTWRKILQKDTWAYTVYKQYQKEICEKEARHSEHAATRDAALFRIPLTSVQKVASAACCVSKKSNKKNKSSNSLHTEFNEIGKTLNNDQSLKVCIACRHPAKYDAYLRRATCTREGCRMDFCTLCNCEYHFSRDCAASKPHSFKYLSEPLPGSKKSKQNLRRL